MTAIPANSPGIAITPRHLLTVTHFPGSGDVHFVTSDNQTVVRSRTAIAAVPGTTDLSIVTLNTELPETITPVNIAPATLPDYLPSPQYRVPMLASNQRRDCLIKDSLAWAAQGDNSPGVYCQNPTSAGRIAFSKDIVSGDSGSPACLIISNALTLVCLWYGGGWGSGERVFDAITAINTITSAAGHTVTMTNLSGFTNYG